METLVLNASYEPYALIPWQRAIVLVFEGKVDVLEAYSDRPVRSVKLALQMPSVVRFRKFISGRKVASRFTRDNVYARDNGKCQYCGEHVPKARYTFDHVLPRSQGGRREWNNIVTSCVPCNQRKGGRTPEKAGMTLLAHPVRPERMPDHLMTIQYQPGMPEQWRRWLGDLTYWNNDLEQE
jgi:5-methylcytosine-specific restriction endonuclease McrA